MTHRTGDQRGQALMVMVIFLTVLLGFTAIAVDAGRFYAERRFLQNAADAAALAGATARTLGRSRTDSITIARGTLTENFKREPTGNPATLPPLVPVYEAGHEGDPTHLLSGIVIEPGSDQVYVALRNKVDYTFGQAVGLSNQWITARAKAGASGGGLPIAVRQFIGLPGPNTAPAYPCTTTGNQFMSVFSTANSACFGSTTDDSGRSDPSAGSAFSSANPNNDPEHHGPIVEILGQGADPPNAASFRGFIALDVRNFATDTSQRFYNGVSSGTSSNSLKSMQAAYIGGGYPGPGFPPVASPPDPNLQVAIMDGNSAGIVVDAISDRYVAGDEVLINVYPGYTMEIPEFALSTPSQLALATTGTQSFSSVFKVSRNQSFTGVVTMATLADTLDPANPMVLGTLTSTPTITYSPNPVSPALGNGTSTSMNAITTSGAAPGVYALWVHGQAGLPYMQAEMVPISIKVGTVSKQFQLLSDATGKVATSIGDSVTFTITVKNWQPNANTAFGGPVTLSVDTPLPGGSVSWSATSLTPTKAGASATLTINTTGMSQGDYQFYVRATGMNGDAPARKVTMLLPLDVSVAPSSSNGDEYVDITGWAVMRITSISSNSVSAYAITPVITDPDDPRLRRGKTARLMPW